MEATIFSSSLSILVNGSPTSDFMASRGLKQGDSLSPFLFLLVAEGLAGLMRNACEFGRFRGFHLNDLIHFEMLQFADATVLICDCSWLNLWCIRDSFLDAASGFLTSEVGKLSFLFLGILVGANHRRKATWFLVIAKLTSRLFSWRGKNLSLSGKGNGDGKRKMYWVTWDKVCLSKQEGGLGVKSSVDFNLSLMCKWGCRLLSDKDALWSNHIKFRYGSCLVNIFGGEVHHNVLKSSLRRRDVFGVCNLQMGEEAWFHKIISCKLENGAEINFWGHCWLGPRPLKELFSNVYEVCESCRSKMGKVGFW
ncbi:uncharacterized protein LOC131614927 [Vicia villosa]|uniref:uncharacterized protein LOC131614927 n=1 Tax=Vicia villosa TaxID=3911 RepID=UPI00273B1F43|nr:uncharacterized protein LOC131614927 [Vicia villosa]